MIIKEPKYSFCDLQIVPAVTTDIEHRSECDAYYENGKLPLFTAPMDSVVDDVNYKFYQDAGINTIIHRNVPKVKRIEKTLEGEWCAYSLSEFEDLFCSESSEIYSAYSNKEQPLNALIDIANGHMQKILDLAVKSKDLAKSLGIKLVLMAGNIANPKTYVKYCMAGIDYARCSIGVGSCCLTSANVAAGYSNASLIDEIYNLRRDLVVNQLQVELEFGFDRYEINTEHFTYTKIIADGGIKNYSDATVALACGADYVMIGSIFSSFIDSCGDFVKFDPSDPKDGYYLSTIEGVRQNIYTFSLPYNTETYKTYTEMIKKYDLKPVITSEPTRSIIDSYSNHMIVTLSQEELGIEEVAKFIIKCCQLKKTAHGMSTKEAQARNLKAQNKEVDYKELKTSEGKTIENDVKYTVKQWTKNFHDYLCSAMSYNNSRELKDFIGRCTLVVKSYGTMLSLNK